MERKKILVTGSNGLLGQKLVQALMNDASVELIATSKGENRMKKIVGFRYIPFDITDKEEVLQLFTEVRPDVVINTAAMTNVDACEVDQKACRKINVDAVQYMVDALEKLQTNEYRPHFIHLSTDFVFDGEAGPYREEDKPNPLSYYAQSKFDSEVIVQKSKLKWAIARTIIVYGVAEEMSRTNIVLWAKNALEKGDPLTIVDDQYRMPTLAEDLAQGCILIAKKEAEGIFHLSGKDFMNIVELVQRVARFFGLNPDLVKPIKTSSLNQAAKRPPRTGFVLDKSITELGYKPHSFEEGLSVLKQQLD